MVRLIENTEWVANTQTGGDLRQLISWAFILHYIAKPECSSFHQWIYRKMPQFLNGKCFARQNIKISKWKTSEFTCVQNAGSKHALHQGEGYTLV